MKQSRRQELKTNELSIYLQQCYDFARRHATYLLGGTVIVVLILVVGTFKVRKQREALADANRIYMQISQSADAVDDMLLERSRSLSNEFGNDETVGPKILEQQASLTAHLALSLTDEADQARRIELLEQAKVIYQRVLNDFGDHPDAVARVRFSLAKLEESLAVMGASDTETVRQLYQKVIDEPTSPFRKMAEEQLDTFDERLALVEIVATRPASDTQPAPAEIIATQPSAATQPATQPGE